MHHCLPPGGPAMFRLSLVATVLVALTSQAADLPVVKDVELQPLAAQVKRVLDTLEFLGSPLPEVERKLIEEAQKNQDKKAASVYIQEVLDRHCLAAVRLSEEMTVMARPGKHELAEQAWRLFLVKVINPKGTDRVELRPDSPNAAPLQRRSSNVPAPTVEPLSEVEIRFLDLAMHNTQPLLPQLSGLEVEYRILQVYCRDAGRKEARLGFNLWENGKK